MEWLIEHLTLLGWLNVFLWVNYLLFIILLFYVRRNDWWRMITGPDGVPQPIEGFLMLWFITAPILIVSVMAFEYEPPSDMWTFMEIIGPVGVLGQLGKQGIQKYNNGKE